MGADRADHSHADAKVVPMIVYLAGLRGMERAEAERRARAWLERFDLVGREGDRVDALSKGNLGLLALRRVWRGRELEAHRAWVVDAMAHRLH